MTDDLRDRIIDTLKRNGFGVDDENRVELADVLIRELGLHREDMNEWAVLAEGFRGHRYVTHWEPNDA